MPKSTDWRSETALDYLDEEFITQFAWECLRRNPDYRRDFAAGPSAEALERWGLRFRGRPAAARRRGNHRLVPRDRPGRGAARASASRLPGRAVA